MSTTLRTADAVATAHGADEITISIALLTQIIREQVERALIATLSRDPYLLNMLMRDAPALLN